MIAVLDSTLGCTGGGCPYRYGEYQIRGTQRMLQKSGIDIVEYGMISASSAGIDSSVYTNTELPTSLVRQNGQMYSVYLDEDSRPPLAGILVRSEKTSDIIRVTFASYREQEDLDYFLELKKKGYLLTIMVSEATQYDEAEMLKKLELYRSMDPWACCICDESGCFTEKTLKSTVALFEKVLPARTWIGFQGRNSLQILETLERQFLEEESGHPRFIETSLLGIAKGPRRPATEAVAKWLNSSFGKMYNVPALEYQADLLKHHAEQATKANELLYYAAAEEGISNQYVIYYSGNPYNVEVPEQMDAFKEIGKSFAFRFSKRAANAAIMAAKKKTLKLGLFVFTRNHPERILEHFVEYRLSRLVRFGVDVIICDNSKDDRTKAIVSNWQIDGYANVSYLRLPENVDPLGVAAMKVVSTLFVNYDYVWPCRDEIITTVENFYADLLELAEKRVQWIALDASFRNGGRRENRIFVDSAFFFAESSARLAVLGLSIFQAAFLCTALQKCGNSENGNHFELICAGLEGLAEHPAKTAILVGDTFCYLNESLPRNVVGEDAFEVWGQQWYDTIIGLPKVYDLYKSHALRFSMEGMWPFRLKSLIQMRAAGRYSMELYLQNRERFLEVSSTAKWKFILVACTPRLLAKQLHNFLNYAKENPKSRVGRVLSKMHNIYLKLGEK